MSPPGLTPTRRTGTRGGPKKRAAEAALSYKGNNSHTAGRSAEIKLNAPGRIAASSRPE